MLMEVRQIAERFNQLAGTLAPRLLPNGRKNGSSWMASGIEDHGRSESLQLNLSGPMIGHWTDHGNAAPGEEKGDLIDLVRLKECGGDMVAAIRWAKAELGIEDDARAPRPEMSQAERQRRADDARARAEAQEAQFAAERDAKAARAKQLYLSGEPIEGTPAEAYLLGRAIGGLMPSQKDGIEVAAKRWPGSLRFRPDAYFKPLEIKCPAMLAGVFTAEGRQIGCHRTFLSYATGRWTKIDHPTAKMMMGNKRGGFIPIHQGSSGKSMREMREGEPVYVTEGIEDALCVRMLKPAARIVAAIDLGNIAAMVLPERARELVIVADRDEGEKQQAALERAIAAQQARGLTVRLVLPPATVNGQAIKDINDWVRATNPKKERRA